MGFYISFYQILLQRMKTVLELAAFARTGASAPVRYYEAFS